MNFSGVSERVCLPMDSLQNKSLKVVKNQAKWVLSQSGHISNIC